MGSSDEQPRPPAAQAAAFSGRRLTAEWQVEHVCWRKDDMSARHYVYIWAEGGYLKARLMDGTECMLVIIGRRPESLKERVGLHIGVRESVKGGERCWPDVRRRGRAIGAEITVVLGALGFWKPLSIFCPPSAIGGAVCPRLRINLDLGPKSVQDAMKAGIRDISAAPTRAVAEAANKVLVETCGAKHVKAAQCLTRDRDALLAFFQSRGALRSPGGDESEHASTGTA